MKQAIIIITLLLFSVGVSAQEYTSRQSESSMKVSGTSTLHDWDIAVETFTGKATIKGETMEAASFVADVKSMKSGTSSMDDNTYKALKAKDHPKITFKSTGITNSGGKIVMRGNLTIAGVTKPVTLNMNWEKWAPNTTSVSGSYTFKMSEFGIDPPRAMLGAIKTGDEITITYKLVLYK